LQGGEAEKSYIQSQAKAGTEARWFYDSKIIKYPSLTMLN